MSAQKPPVPPKRAAPPVPGSGSRAAPVPKATLARIELAENVLRLRDEQLKARVVYFEPQIQTNAELDAITAQVVALLTEQNVSASLAQLAMAFIVGTLVSDRHEQHLRASRRRLRALASIDPLTQVPNRRHFEELAVQALKQDPPSSAVLMMFDVDHFKRINDQLGHAGGDRALRLVARCVRELLRVQDVPCRHGGDEFVLLLRHASVHDAMRVAARLVERLQGRSLDAALPTVSLNGALLAVLLVVSIAGVLAAPWLVSAYAAGYDDDRNPRYVPTPEPQRIDERKLAPDTDADTSTYDERNRRRGRAAGLAQRFQPVQVALDPERLGHGVAVAPEQAQRQRQPGVGHRVAPGDLDGDVVVRAGVGDAAPDDALVVVDQHGLAGGRAQVDAEVQPHDTTSRWIRSGRGAAGGGAPVRRAWSICRYDSMRFLMLAWP